MAKKQYLVTLGNRVKYYRIQCGLTQDEVAERCPRGLSQAAISAIEAGRRPNPGWRTIRLLEGVLGLEEGALTVGYKQ